VSVPQVAIAVSTQSEPVSSWNDQTTLPSITIDGNPVANEPQRPPTASGWQVVVLDQAADLTSAAAVLSNRFVWLQQDNGAWSYWEAMYSIMTTQILTSGNTGSQIVLVASYALDVNIPPTNDALELLLTYGAGPQLQSWLTGGFDIGSEGGNWTNTPANYVFIGASGLGYGNGTEEFNVGTDGIITAGVTANFANPFGG
jgi:hypothetical protein